MPQEYTDYFLSAFSGVGTMYFLKYMASQGNLAGKLSHSLIIGLVVSARVTLSCNPATWQFVCKLYCAQNEQDLRLLSVPVGYLFRTDPPSSVSVLWMLELGRGGSCQTNSLSW